VKICPDCQHRFDTPGWQCPDCGCVPPQVGGFFAFAPDLAHLNDGFPADGFDRLVRIEDGSFWFRSRNKLITWALGKYFPGARDFLEIGCGTGFVLRGIRQAFPGLQLSGAEIYSTGLVHAAQRLPGVDLFQMDARAMPFDDEYEVIGAFDVLEHILEDQQVLEQMFRAVKPGGGIILTVPQHRFLWSRIDDHSNHVRRYAASQLVGEVRQAST